MCFGTARNTVDKRHCFGDEEAMAKLLDDELSALILAVPTQTSLLTVSRTQTTG